MSQTAFTVKILIDSQPAAGLSVQMSSGDGAYGIKRNDTNAVVVAAGTAMVDLGGGVYSYIFDDPAANLSYTGWVSYVYDGESYSFSNVFNSSDDSDSDTGAISAAATASWDSAICYEDRGRNFRTSRWRLGQVNTASISGNTDAGLLWLTMSKSGDIVDIQLHKSLDAAPASLVASGSVDISPLTLAGENSYVDFTLAAAPGGVTVSARLHQYIDDGTCPILAALCTDDDLRIRYGDIDSLSAYDSDYGLSSFIRLAGDELLGKIAAMFAEPLGGAAGDWWLQRDYQLSGELSRIVNPSRLRKLCALKALALALGREALHGGGSAMSELRDNFDKEFNRELQQLSLSISETNDYIPTHTTSTSQLHLSRG